MTSTGSRRALRAAPAVCVLLLVVLCGRYLLGTASPSVSAVPIKGTPAVSASGHDLLAVAARVPAPMSEARLDLGLGGLVVACGLLLAFFVGLAHRRGTTVLEMLGAQWRRRGPPALLFV